MKMKKMLAVLSALVTLMGVTGCNSSSESQSAPTSSASSGVSSGNENAAKEHEYSEEGVFPIVSEGSDVELTVWAILSSSIEDYSTNIQSKWYEDYSGVKINWINVPAEGWANQFQLSVMSGEYPDIYLYDFATSEVQACVDFGAIIPLNDLIEEHCPNIRTCLEDDPELKDTITAYDGNIYTTFAKSYNMSAYKQKLWVNSDWLATYEAATGKGIPETTDEFKDMLIYFKNNDMNGNGDTSDEVPYMGFNGLDGMYHLFNSFIPSNSSSEGFGCYQNDAGELAFAYNTTEFREALKYAYELFSLGLISDQTFTINSSDRYFYTSTSNDKATIGVTTAVTADQLIQLSSEEGMMDYSDYTAIAPMKGPDGQQGFVTGGEYTVALKNAITTSCEHPEIAAKWLDYWFSEEGRLWSVNGGMENEHWEYVSGESIVGASDVVSPLVDNSKNLCWAGQGVSYMLTADDFLHMDASSINTNSVLSTYAADMKYHDHMIQSIWPSIVWTDGSEQVNDLAMECSELQGMIKDYVTQSYTEFIMGTRDINDDAEWDAYVSELDNMGLSRFIELVDVYIHYGE